MPSTVLTLKNSSMSPTRPHRSSIASRQKRRNTEGSMHREANTACSLDDADTTDEMSPFEPSRRCPSAGLSKNGGGDTEGLAAGRPAPYQEGRTPGPSAPLAIPLFAYKRQSYPRPVTTRQDSQATNYILTDTTQRYLYLYETDKENPWGTAVPEVRAVTVHWSHYGGPVTCGTTCWTPETNRICGWFSDLPDFPFAESLRNVKRDVMTLLNAMHSAGASPTGGSGGPDPPTFRPPRFPICRIPPKCETWRDDIAKCYAQCRGVADGGGGSGGPDPSIFENREVRPQDSRMMWPKSGVFPIFRVFWGRLATLPTIRPPSPHTHSKIRGDAPGAVHDITKYTKYCIVTNSSVGFAQLVSDIVAFWHRNQYDLTWQTIMIMYDIPSRR